MSLGGAGIARLREGKDAGLVLFIPYSAPGDVLRVRITEQKKNFAYAEIVEIVTPSPHRRVAPCPVFGQCGGCNWQHIIYPEQLRQKQAIVEEQLSKVIESSTQVLPTVASAQEFRYRNRIQVHFQDQKWGYYARKSHHLIETRDCLIAEEALIQKLETLGKTESQRIQVSLQKDLNVVVEDENQTSSDDLGFSQVNRFQNENLIKTVLEWSDPSATETWTEIWDLYAGSGNFTVPLYEKYRKSKITAVELSSQSVSQAQRWIRDNNLSPQKIRFVLADVEQFLKRAKIAPLGLIVLDPPRTGCSPQSIGFLAQQRVKKILYISCNPATLSRDLALLMRARPGASKISRFQVFDMFPQTDHVEVLVELTVDDLPK